MLPVALGQCQIACIKHGIGQESPMENKTGLEDISAAHAKLRADVVMCISQR